MPTDPMWNSDLSHKLPPTYDAAVAEFERDLIRQVNHEMSGQDEQIVQAELSARLRGRLPGVELDDLNLHAIAQAIADGTLTSWLARSH